MRRRYPISSVGRSALAVLLALTFLAGWAPRTQCLLGSSCEPIRQDEAATADCCRDADGAGPHEHPASPDPKRAPCDCGAPCCGVSVLMTATTTSALPASRSGGESRLPPDDQAVCGLAPHSIFHPPRAA